MLVGQSNGPLLHPDLPDRLMPTIATAVKETFNVTRPLAYFIFVADAADIVRGEFFVMWRNFRYRESLDVEKLILRCGDILDIEKS